MLKKWLRVRNQADHKVHERGEVRVSHRRRELELGRGGLVSDHSRIHNEADETPSRCLATVGQCDAYLQTGRTVFFNDSGSFMLDKATGEINVLRQECGNDMLDLWVPQTNELDFGMTTGKSCRARPMHAVTSQSGGGGGDGAQGRASGQRG